MRSEQVFQKTVETPFSVNKATKSQTYTCNIKNKNDKIKQSKLKTAIPLPPQKNNQLLWILN